MMNIRIKLMRGKLKRARSVWEAHTDHCACCRKARSAATLCEKGVELWTRIAQHTVDIESLQAGRPLTERMEALR